MNSINFSALDGKISKEAKTVLLNLLCEEGHRIFHKEMEADKKGDNEEFFKLSAIQNEISELMFAVIAVAEK